MTESQVVSYIAILKEQMATLKAPGVTGPAGADNATLQRSADQRIEASITAHGMTSAEYHWVGEQLGKLWPSAMLQKQWTEKTKPDLEKQIAAKTAESADAKAKLAAYEHAQKDGKPVLAVDREGLTAEVKSDEESIKPISDEVALHEKDASDAEALAKNPPERIAADDKSAYIDKKKNEAQTATDAAKDSRERLKEAQKNLDDARARLAVASGTVEHPGAPMTQEQKAAMNNENEQAITATKQTILDDEKTIAMKQQALAAGPVAANSSGKDKLDPDNLALVQKHLSEYLEATGTRTDAK